MIIESQVHGLVTYCPFRGAITMVIRLLELSCLLHSIWLITSALKGDFSPFSTALTLLPTLLNGLGELERNLI